MPLEPGATHEVRLTVTEDRTAHAAGNAGVTVLATPALVGLLETACAGVLHPHLAPGASSVGTLVEVRHLAPTPVGMEVRARATLVEVDGRRYRFAVEVWDAREQIARGHHERVVVGDLQKFLTRATEKARA